MDFCWVTVKVGNMEKSLAFYRDALGLALNGTMKPMPGTEIAFLGSGATQVELVRDDASDACAYGKDISLGFAVESLEATLEFLGGRGIPLHSGPFSPNPMIKFAYVLDPDGLRIQIVENVEP